MATMKRERCGFIVADVGGDFVQPLALITGEHLPPGGILEWPDVGKPVFVFPSRQSAREAVVRTDHYRQAFAPAGYPHKSDCKVVPLESAKPES